MAVIKADAEPSHEFRDLLAPSTATHLRRRGDIDCDRTQAGLSCTAGVEMAIDT